MINELLVEIPMFPLCDVRLLNLAMTGCLSALLLEEKKINCVRQCVSTCVEVNVSVLCEDFRYFFERTCCEKVELYTLVC